MKIFSVEEVRKRLLEIAPEVFANPPVLAAYLYGSFSTGLVHPFSDLDIGIYVEKRSDMNYLRLELSLALEIDRKVGLPVNAEVRVMNFLPLTVTGQILTEGILIFCSDEIARVDFETSVRTAYFDFLPVIQEYTRAYLEANRAHPFAPSPSMGEG